MVRYIYIFSSGHSGSTLLDLLIGNMSGTVSLGEVKWLPLFLKTHEHCTCGKPPQTCPFWNPILDELGLAGDTAADQTINAFRLSLEAERNNQLQKLSFYARLASAVIHPQGCAGFGSDAILKNMIRLYDAVLKTAPAEAVVDSSKSIMTAQWLRTRLPRNARVIHLIRDGRAVMASAMRKEVPAERAAKTWLHDNRMAGSIFRSGPSMNLKALRYEDLCRDPESTMRELADFLEKPYTEDILHLRGRERHLIGGNRMRFSGEDKIVNVETWKSRLTEKDLAVFERTAGPLNRKLGYSGT
ncbi:MAG: sulfotransferase [Verrucomicrobia bacterium]|nr:sulfotransferase [Verrucomicrobiota bacterium]